MKKKLLTALLPLTVVATLTGCGNNNVLICEGPGPYSSYCTISSNGEKKCSKSSDGILEFTFADDGTLEKVTIKEISIDGITTYDSTKDGWEMTKKEMTVDDWMDEFNDLCDEAKEEGINNCTVSKENGKAVAEFDFSGDYFIKLFGKDKKDVTRDTIPDMLNKESTDDFKYTCK